MGSSASRARDSFAWKLALGLTARSVLRRASPIRWYVSQVRRPCTVARPEKRSSDASPSIQADTDSSREISVSTADLTVVRSEEPTSALQSLLTISDAVSCLNNKPLTNHEANS